MLLIVSSYDHTPYRHIVLVGPPTVKSVLAQKSRKKWKSTFLPLRQKSYRAEIKFIGGHFSRRICQWRSKIHSSSKTTRSGFDGQSFQKKLSDNFFRRRKMKRWESSETRFGKVWQDSEPCSRGKRQFKNAAGLNCSATYVRKRGSHCPQGPFLIKHRTVMMQRTAYPYPQLLRD